MFGQTQAIDDVYRSTIKSDDPEKTAEGKKIVDELARMKYEVQHDRQLTPIRDDGFPDVEIYNKELEQLGNPGWLDVNWLYCECYLFRCAPLIQISSEDAETRGQHAKLLATMNTGE